MKLAAADLREQLTTFSRENNFNGKGPLCVALVVTEHARIKGLPLNPEELITEGGGQVLGLGKAAVQAILKRHDINRVLASEGGRTSRGSLHNMRQYVAFLNQLNMGSEVDLDLVEEFWIVRVFHFFAGKPFKIKLDGSRSLRTVVRDVIEQAQERQKTTPSVYYAGAVLQHMVGAKLDCVLGKGKLQHNSFTAADESSKRAGDFFIGDVALHVTTSPGEAIIERCRENLDDGYRAMLITIQKGLNVAEGLAANAGLAERIDIFEIEQFVALNLHELGKFSAVGRQTAVIDLVNRYNEIVEEVETDPSLKIELRR